MPEEAPPKTIPDDVWDEIVRGIIERHRELLKDLAEDD